VDETEFKPADRRIFMFDTQYFGDVPDGVWEFIDGGYCVCHEWVRSRSPQTLRELSSSSWRPMSASKRQALASIDELKGGHGRPFPNDCPSSREGVSQAVTVS
jgi:hypothetical protein